MTTCPHPGALRASLDGERPDLAPHLAGCPDCAATVEDVAADARYAAAAVGALGEVPHGDAEAALARARASAAPPVADLRARRRPRWSRPLASRAAALLLVVTGAAALVGTPAGRAAASAVLESFRSERLAVVTIDPDTADLSALAALSDVATVEGLEGTEVPVPVADLAEAARVSGVAARPLQDAVLPDDLAGAPVTVLASAPRDVRVRFDTARSPELPPALDGVVLTVHVPGAVVQMAEAGQTAGAGADGAPALAAATAAELRVDVEGATLAEVRDALLTLPGLPPETVAQLGQLDRWESTLPIPVPPGVTWQDTTVNGQPGLAFGDNTGIGSALVWNAGGQIHAVAGTQPIDVLRAVAEGSR